MIWIRKARRWSVKDVLFLRNLRNQEEDEPTISLREHLKWWVHLWPLVTWLLIINGKRCGYLRVSQQGIVSIAIVRHYQGQSLGRYLLTFGQKNKPKSVFYLKAIVRRNNLRSNHLFSSCGFEIIAQTGSHLVYSWPSRKKLAA